MGKWHRITKAVQRESGTNYWHRRDVRRTSACIMKALGINARMIDEILAYNAKKDDGTSEPLEAYLSSAHLLDHIEYPKKVNLDKLAEALCLIESDLQNQ